MLYIKEADGSYLPAQREAVFHEAKRLASYRLTLSNPLQAKEAVSTRFLDRKQEVFACLFLDSMNRILGYRELFFGSINSATVHPREVFRQVMELNAASVIFAHNHPSGSLKPSQNDIEVTEKLTRLLRIIEVRVLDHIIIGDGILSMAEKGLLPHHQEV